MEEFHTMQTADRILLLQEMLSCGDKIDFWIYGNDGHLAETNSDRLVLNLFFERSSMQTMLAHFGEKKTPIILSSHLGLMWAAAQETEDNLFYVIGPVLSSEMSTSDIAAAVRRFDVDLSWREGFIRLFETLPAIGTMLFYQYAVMLHYCVTGEKLSRMDLNYQISSIPSGKRAQAQKKSRDQVYRAEVALLACVRNGDLNYRTPLARAGKISQGVRVKTKDPIHQAIISTTSFTTLCVRAAIEGGLSPEVAYTVGDSYIQSMAECTTLSDLSVLNHQMLEDFIRRVHACRENPAHSKMVRDACAYIEFHVEDPLSLALLAKELGYSQSHLSRCFKAEMGVGISQYIRAARVEKAKVMLETSSQPIFEIASSLHFSCSSHFSNSFKEFTGLLPQQWRNQRGI